MTRSLTALADGTPTLRFGSETAVDHRTPFVQRWGGWFVTGRTGALRHRGNTVVDPGDVPRPVVPGGPFDVTSLAGAVGLDAYPAATSDVVALAVFNHETQRAQPADAPRVGVARGRPRGTAALESPAVLGLLKDAVDYLTFADETPLPAALDRASPFAAWFSARGAHDSQGRTLHALDLKTRLFRYPLSFAVESPAFDALPDDMHEALRDRLTRALAAPASPARARHDAADRRAALEMLKAKAAAPGPGRGR